MDGRAQAANELALVAGVTPQAAIWHARTGGGHARRPHLPARGTLFGTRI
jgi:hypothetical protein